MSQTLTNNLLRLHFARASAQLFARDTNRPKLMELSITLMAQCQAASNAILWHGAKINLKHVKQKIQTFSAIAYGDPNVAAIDGLRLIGLAIVELENAMAGQTKPDKKQVIDACLQTAIKINEFFDQELVEQDVYDTVISDANIMQTVMAA